MEVKHILSARQFTKRHIENLFYEAAKYESGNKGFPAADRVLCSLFFEPSTRTRLSFESAMLRLGGQVLSVENAFDSSSDRKGETLEDTIKTISQLADVIVLRHPVNGMAKIAASVSSCPIINAGDGSSEHPSQALIDLYTIFREKKDISSQKMLIIGDPAYARTIRSLATLLDLYEVDYKIVDNSFPQKNLPYEQLIAEADVIYMTRIQVERRGMESTDIPDNVMTIQTVKKMKNDAIILHPLPRSNELNPNVDKDPRAAYFRQVKYGLYLRMALLGEIFAENADTDSYYR